MKAYIVSLFALALVACDASHRRVHLSDVALSQRLIGAWSIDVTNRNGVHFIGVVTYRTNGVVLWHGSLTETSGMRRDYDDSGVWRVQDAYLLTKVTNSSFRSLADEPEYRDEVVSAMDADYTYRDDRGTLHTRRRKP